MNTNDYLAANFRDIHGFEDFYTQSRREFFKRTAAAFSFSSP